MWEDHTSIAFHLTDQIEILQEQNKEELAYVEEEYSMNCMRDDLLQLACTILAGP